MNILVTGGSGFIGSAFLRLLVPRHPEHQFTNLDVLTYAANPRNLEGIDTLPNYAFERIDLCDAKAVVECVERTRPDVVVHFAAESHVDRSILGPLAFIQTNVVGTLNLLEACRAIWPKNEGLFHHVSTDEVYGSLGETGYFTETTAYDPSSPYSASKASSDHLVRAWGHTYGMRVRITNCSNNYGPRQFPEKLIPLMILRCLSGEPLPIYGQGVNVRDWLFVDDHCEAIWTVIERGRDGETYNIGGNAEKRNIDVVDRICAVVAEATGKDVSALLALKQYVTDRPGHDLRYAIDATKIRDELGWTPKHTFDTGIEDTVRWYLDNAAWIEDVRSGGYRRWIESNYGARSAGDAA